MTRAIALLVVSAAIVGCAAFDSYVTPPKGPGTDYPCGYYGVECSDHTCCGEHESCRDADAMSAVPFCEYMGPDDTGNLGARKPRHPASEAP